MTSAAKGHEGPPDQQDAARKSSTQDHTRRSSLISDSSVSSSPSLQPPLSPVAQSFLSQAVLHPISPLSALHDASPALSRVIDQIKGLRSCTPYWSEFCLTP